MNCSKCGVELDKGAKYCRECGAKVENRENIANENINSLGDNVYEKKQKYNDKEKNAKKVKVKSSISVKIVLVIATLSLISAISLRNGILLLISLIQLLIVILIMLMDKGIINNNLKKYKRSLFFVATFMIIPYSLNYPTDRSTELSGTTANNIVETQDKSTDTVKQNNEGKAEKNTKNMTTDNNDEKEKSDLESTSTSDKIVENKDEAQKNNENITKKQDNSSNNDSTKNVSENKSKKSETKENQENLSVTNSPELAKVLSKDSDYDLYKNFAEKYKGRRIEFDGRVDYSINNGNNITRFDFLLSAGDYDPDTQIGPTFKFENVDYSELNTDLKEVTVGKNVHIIAEVESFDYDKGIFYLKPVSVKGR